MRKQSTKNVTNIYNPTVARMMSANIEHITLSDCELLDIDAARTQIDPVNSITEGGCIIVWKQPKGYILHVDEQDTEDGLQTELFVCAIEHGYSENLLFLMTLAQRHQCSKLNIEWNGRTYQGVKCFPRRRQRTILAGRNNF
jgi:hypothetical protein